MEKPYSVCLWGSHPDDDNDDCWTGDDFETIEDAKRIFSNPDSHFEHCHNWMYVEIDGPEINEVRKNPNYRKERNADREWQNEFAMQNGMAFGCDGYNDANGY